MPLTRNQSNAATQAKLSAANNSETSTTKDSADHGGTSAETEPPRRDSPENCSICLGPFNNKSFTSSCAHSFCFVCLKQWSKVKAECPLCKQPFTSIFHNIRSNQQYDIYELPHQPSNPIDYNIFNYVGGAVPSFTAPTHHHHLFSLSQPAFDADLTLSNFSRFQFRHRRYDRILNPLSIHGEHPYSFNGPSVNPTTHISAATWPRGPEEFRRMVYRRNIGPPTVILGCENSTYRLTPAMVAASAHRIHRIMPWLTRELRVLVRSHQNVRLAISIIQPLLTQVTIDSMCFYDKIAPLIGRRSRQFVDEFAAFANSALSVQAYDRKAMYRRREMASAIPSSSSSTSSENDVVEVTDISPDVYPSGASANPSVPGPSQTQPLNLSRSGWDSPTPGPSWDTANSSQAPIDRVSVSSESDDPVYRPDLRDSDSDQSKAGSDIIFVKYDKPWNERSPIKLTSESEGGNGNELTRKKKKSKHKKKKKEPVVDNGEASGVSVSKKDRGKKSSSKSKHKDKSKSSPRAMAVASEDERESTGVCKRRHSQDSTEQHHKGKKHKKSKSKKERLSDREIVDLYFAQAMSQDKEEDSSGSEDIEVGVSSSKSKDKDRSSSKEKSKKKKKNRKHSRDSHKNLYKKHPSGHKKSSNRLPEGLAEPHSSRPRILSRSPIRQNQLGGPSRSDAMGSADGGPGPLEASSSTTVSHSVVPGFQPPYLGMPPDAVQHIPVNLWVSAWPTLSVSHTYPHPPPPPPSSIPLAQTAPQSSNTSSSTMTSNPPHNEITHNRPAAPDRLSISSDSSTDSTDSESDDAQDLQIPSLQNVHSRTKQWLETNFPELGRTQASSTSATTTASSSNNTTSSSTHENATTSTRALMKSSVDHGSHNPTTAEELHLEHFVGNDIDMPAAAKDVIETEEVEVVSIPSGEDVVICSSDDDSDSIIGDLWVIDADDSSHKKPNNNTTITNQSRSNNNDNKLNTPAMSNISTLSFPRNVSKQTESQQQLVGQSLSSDPSQIILPPVNKSFQPFKLQRKPAMGVSGKDPFFPPMTHSSDEDGEVDGILHHSTGSAVNNPAGFPHQTTSSSQSNGLNAMAVGQTQKFTTNYVQEDIVMPLPIPSVSSLTTIFDRNSNKKEHASPESTAPSNPIISARQPLATQPTISTSLNSSGCSTLPPLNSSSVGPSVKSVSSSGFSYLPYPSLPQAPTTVPPSILPGYVPQTTIPPPPPPVSLPLSFPFSQIPPQAATTVQTNSAVPSHNPLQSQGESDLRSQFLAPEISEDQDYLLMNTTPPKPNDSSIEPTWQSNNINSMAETVPDHHIGEIPQSLCRSDDNESVQNNAQVNNEIDFPQSLDEKKLCDIESNSVPMTIQNEEKKDYNIQGETVEIAANNNNNDNKSNPSEYYPIDYFNSDDMDTNEKLISDVNLSASAIGNSVISMDHLSQPEVNGKPFDALEESSSDDAPFPMPAVRSISEMSTVGNATHGPSTVVNTSLDISTAVIATTYESPSMSNVTICETSSVSNANPIENSTCTKVSIFKPTVSENPALTDSNLLSSESLTSTSHTVRSSTISRLPYNSELPTFPVVSDVFRPYSDNAYQTVHVHPFKDALASSSSSSSSDCSSSSSDSDA